MVLSRGAGLRLRRGRGGGGGGAGAAGPSVPPVQMKSMPQRRRRMTKTAPVSSWTVTVGGACLVDFRERTTGAAGGGTGPGAGPCRAQREAATAAWRRRALAGRLLAWASRLPAGVVSMAECMCAERFARRKDVTRLVRSSGGGGGMCIGRDMAAVVEVWWWELPMMRWM